MAQNQANNTGIGFVGLLTIVFVTLKLTKNIDWSWWWVTSPLWITAILCILVISFAVWYNTKQEKKLTPYQRYKNDRLTL